MPPEEELRGTDILFALTFLVCVVAGTWWFFTIVNYRFAAALVAHLMALASGGR